MHEDAQTVEELKEELEELDARASERAAVEALERLSARPVTAPASGAVAVDDGAGAPDGCDPDGTSAAGGRTSENDVNPDEEK